VETRTELGASTDSACPSTADHSKNLRRTNPRLIGAVAAIAVLVVAASVLTLGGRDEAAESSPASVPEHPLAATPSARTVRVSPAMPMPSAHARRLSAMLEEGAMPDRPIMADVMTDTDCTPDAQMISRCQNVMRLADGRRIVLRHPHDMSNVPCLAPGERVRLIPSGV
jgi:hypothetical protein